MDTSVACQCAFIKKDYLPLMLKQLLLLTIILILVLASIPDVQRHFIYFPNKNTPERQQFSAADMQDITLQTQDGITLHAWYKPPTAHHPILLYLHGNGGHRGHRMGLVRPLLTAGFGVLLLDYRGYGGNPGKPTEQGLYADGRAAMRFLQKQSRPVVIYGESLGTGVATQLATEFPLCALVLQSPYTSLTAAGRALHPWLPVFLKDRYDSLQKITTIHVPLLILSGNLDDLVPHEQSVTLFNTANQPKEMISFPDKGHHDLWDAAFVQQVAAFIGDHCKA